MQIPGLPAIPTEQVLCLPTRLRQRILAFCLRWGYYEEALPLAKCLAREQPEGILYRVWHGQCLLGAGRLDDAQRVIAAVHAAHPESVLAAGALIDLLLASGRFGPAFDACQELFRPPHGERVAAWQKLAAYHLAVGEPSKALACCRRCEALRRERADKGRGNGEAPGPFLRLLARVHEANGNEEAAVDARRACAERESQEAAVLSGLLAECGSVTGDQRPETRDQRPERGRAGDGETARKQPIPPFPPFPRPLLHHSITPSLQPPPHHPTTPPPPPPRECRASLKSVFGHAGYLPGQEEVIGRVMAGEDVLAILPTGGGKSLCYQLPALHLPGVVVVISPLIALMRDQVENVPPALVPKVTVINSSLEWSQIRERLQGIASGRFRLVYAAPERLRQWPFVHALRRAGVSLFVVDEAHCISLWGHDFRPDYFFIGPALRHLGEPRVLGLTATATPEVRGEIGERLGRRFSLVNAGIARPNLHLEVVGRRTDDEKTRFLADFARAQEGSGIVYARSRAKCEELARMLRDHRVGAIHYHAGMAAEERDAAQAAFMGGERRVVCATIAFGMGIDKTDIRWILHYNLPKSVESYWQEAGRAGRDGLPARCVLLSTAADQVQLRRWLRKEALDAAFVWDLHRAARELVGGPGPGRVVFDDLARAVVRDEVEIRVALGLLERLRLIERHPDLPRTLSIRPLRPGDAACAGFITRARLRPLQTLEIDSLELCERTAMHPSVLESRLLEWRDAGWMEVRSSGRDALLGIPEPPADADAQLKRLLRLYQDRQEQRVSQVIAYARGRRCRHAFIARVFGEPPPQDCRACDVCAPAMPPTVPSTRSPRPPAPQPPAHPEPASPSMRAPGTQPPAPSSEVVSPETIVLRTVAGLPTPVGRRDLVNILRGSAAPAWSISCPAFAALRSWSRGNVGRLIDRLQRMGHLRTEPSGEVPFYFLTPRGRESLPAGSLPPDPEDAPGAGERHEQPESRGAPDEASAQELYERLRAWRGVVAIEDGSRAFATLNDTALRGVAAARPQSMAALAVTQGLTPAARERYGDAIIHLVQEHEAAEAPAPACPVPIKHEE